MEKNTETPIAEATTLREVNLHLGYLRDKMNDNTNARISDMLDIKEKLRIIADNQVGRSEFEGLRETVKTGQTDIQFLKDYKNTLSGKIWGISFSAGAAWAVISLLAAHYWHL